MKSKETIRTEIALQRKQLDSVWIAGASSQIIEYIQYLPEFHQAKCIALYMAVPGEVDLESIISVCQAQEMQICIPVFNEELQIYEMAEITMKTEFTTGHYGIKELVDPNLVPISQIDLFIVPGVAFDYSGNRLGRGKGYYDRLLKDYNGATLAVAFEFQILPEVPTDNHDIPIETIVTETKIIKVENEH